jgi:hypothetical protein
MFEEITEEAKDFFEDIFEHLFEKDEKKHKDSATVLKRTKLAYHFTERVDSLMKIIFGISILMSALVASVWGFTAVGDMVRALITNPLGRSALFLIGVSYMINGIWRLFHSRP